MTTHWWIKRSNSFIPSISLRLVLLHPLAQYWKLETQDKCLDFAPEGFPASQKGSLLTYLCGQRCEARQKGWSHFSQGAQIKLLREMSTRYETQKEGSNVFGKKTFVGVYSVQEGSWDEEETALEGVKILCLSRAKEIFAKYVTFWKIILLL